MRKYRLAAAIPAAGLSSRKGAFKPLLQFGGETVIEASVSNALSAADHAFVVLGKRADELRELLAARFGERLSFAVNPDYASSDMLASIRIALALMDGYDAFFISPADMPLISPAVYKTLADAFRPDDGILMPVASGRRATPVVRIPILLVIMRFWDMDSMKGMIALHRTAQHLRCGHI